MSETFFPVNDLLRRKVQTTLVIAGLTLSVASTLFLLLAADRIGLGLLPTSGNTLTSGLSMIVWQFIVFISILIFTIGALIVSFMVSAMMRQRIRDIGLIKATGCPNQILFGYYLTELLVIALAGCVLGTILGLLINLGSAGIFSTFGMQVPEKPLNVWITFTVFAVFFGLALVFGTQPILATTKIEPSKAMSPSHYAGIFREEPFKPISKFGISAKDAFRQLIRRKYASQRVLLCLSIIFLLMTVTVTGGIIAANTTTAWINDASGNGTVLVAHREMIAQYEALLLKFSAGVEDAQFNYTDPKYAIKPQMITELKPSQLISGIDPRLVTVQQIREIPGVVISGSSSETTVVGDHHQGSTLVIGLQPPDVLSNWHVQGGLLAPSDNSEAVIGDSVARNLFAQPLNQEIGISSEDFGIKGVCIDPINNGFVTYVPIGSMEEITGTDKPNVVLLGLSGSANRGDAINAVRTTVQAINADFDVVDLEGVFAQNVGYMKSIWFSIGLLPLFSLATASLCLVGFVVMMIDEQRREFGIFRAVGLNSKAIVKIISWQSLLVALAAFGASVSVGIMLTIVFLIPEPIVTSSTIVYATVLLLIAFAVTFTASLYPALEFSRTNIIDMAEHAS